MRNNGLRSALIVFGFMLCLAANAVHATNTAEADLTAVWQRVQTSGAYRFSADIEQTTVPGASLANAGRGSKRTLFYIEGATDLATESLHLALWSDGGSVLIPESGLEVRVTGDTAEARQQNGDWEEIDNFTGLFAPGGDFVAYTQAAENIVNQGIDRRSTALGEMLVTRYTFDINGRLMAELLHRQMVEDATRQGLPATVQLEAPKAYANMTGTGELWVGNDGLPLRQRFELRFPIDEHDYLTTATISVNFAEFAPLPATAAFGIGPGSIHGLLASFRVIVARQTVPVALWLAGILLSVAVIIAHRRARAIYMGIVLAVISSMLATPLLNSRQVYAYSVRQTAQQSARGPGRAERDLAKQLAEPDFAPNADPLRVAQVRAEILADDEPAPFHDPRCAGDPTGDIDGDSLTNMSECLLGTLLDKADTDEDGVADNVEVSGYAYAGHTWYSDPLKIDTNNDGLSDARERLLAAEGASAPEDTDGDGVPDFWDDDNDGDGVPDRLDLSPYASTRPDGSTGQVFTAESPFALMLDELVAGQLTTVEFQLVPTNPDHLWYTQNVLDWPDNDRQGQLQDADGATFFDVDAGVPPSPNANGDVRMVPMLEIEISGPETNLPPASTCTNDDGIEVTCYPLLEKFGIGVRELVAGEVYAAYVPLQLVTDGTGERNVAFYGRMLYAASGVWGNPDSVRLVWAVQMLNDVCAAFEDNICVRYSTMNEPQIVQVYPDDWYLAGLHVTEEHGADVAIIYEDPAAIAQLPAAPANYDKPLYLDTLYGLAYGLTHTFLAGADCDSLDSEGDCVGNGQRDVTVAELERRFNYATNDGISVEDRWSLPNVLRVERNQYDSLDLGLMATAITETVALLEESFTPVWTANDSITPTIMLALEDNHRDLNLDDEWAGSPNLRWSGSMLTLTLAQYGDDRIDINTISAVKWSPYAYDPGEGWSGADIRTYYDRLTEEMVEVFAGEDAPQEERDTYAYLSQILYLGIYQGAFQNVQLTSPLNDLDSTILATDYQLPTRSVAAALGIKAFKFVPTVLKSSIKFSKDLAQVSAYLQAAQNAPGGAARAPQFIHQKALSSVGTGGLFFGAIVTIIAGTLLVMMAVVAIVTLAGNDTSADWIQPLSQTVSVVGILLQSITLVKIIWTSLQIVKSTIAAAASLPAALRATVALSSKVVGIGRAVLVIGLILSVSIAIGVFIYAWGSGQVESGTIDFNRLVALTIAAILLAIVFFFLALTIVGAIVVGVIALADSILALAGVEWSISGWLTDTIAKVVYNYFLLQDNDIDTGKPALTWANPQQGIVSGNQLTVGLPITTTLTQNAAGDLFGPIFNRTLNRNSLVYSLSEEPEALKTKLDDRSTGYWSEWSTCCDGGTTYYARGADEPQYTGTLTAGVNRTLPLTLNTGYALNGVSWWVIPLPFFVTFGYPETATGSRSDSLGDTLVLDVLPATLDEFVDVANWAGGRLRSVDADGDGLLSTRYGGVDPDDTAWDTDGDLLSDSYELTLRGRVGTGGGEVLNPRARDTDQDDVHDSVEMRYATNPGRRDSDGDGIQDILEIPFFTDGTTRSFGGWQIPAIYEPDTGQTASYQVWSDPLRADGDGDGMSDLFEQSQTTVQTDPWAEPSNPQIFNPNVWGVSPVALYVEDDTTDSFVAPNATVTYSTTTENNLDAGQELVGELSLALPDGVNGGPLSRSVSIESGGSASLVSELTFTNQSTAAYDLTSNMKLANYFETRWTWDPPESVDADSAKGRVQATAATPLTGWTGAQLAVTRERASGDDNVFAYVVDGDGRITASTALWQNVVSREVTDPDVACNDDGVCLVTWAVSFPSGGTVVSRVYARQFNRSLTDSRTTIITPHFGSPQTTEFRNTAVATDGLDFMLAWTRSASDAPAATRVEFARIVAGGNAAESGTLTTVDGAQAVDTAWSGASYTFVWSGVDTISWRRVNQNGNPSDNTIYSVAGDGWPRSDGNKRPPAIAYDAISRQTLIAYSVAGGELVTRQAADDSSPAIPLATGVDGVDVTVGLAADSENGGWIVAWTPPGGGRALYQAIAPTGAARGGQNALDQSALTTLSLICNRPRALVELPFNEDPGATVFEDSSGNGKNATCVDNCPQSGISGRIGNAVSFNGAEREALTVGDLDLTERSFTMSSWVRYRSGDRAGAVMSIGDMSSGANPAIYFGISSGAGSTYMNCEISSSVSPPLVHPIPDDNWHHWACTYEASSRRLTLFVDGKEVGVRTASNPHSGVSPLFIGTAKLADSDFILHFTGDVDSVNVLDRALSAAEIADLAAGAVAAYALDEPAGAEIVVNAIGNGFNGRCESTATCPELGVSGAAFTAARFDGQDDHIAVGSPDNSLPLINSSFTIAAWVNRDRLGQNHTIFSQGVSATSELGFTFGFSDSNRLRCGTLDAPMATSAAFTEPGWRHVACVFNVENGALQIYYDGAQVLDVTGRSALIGAGSTAYIGQRLDNRQYFSGAIDELGVWLTPLTRDQIEALVNKVKVVDESVLACQLPAATGNSLTFYDLVLRQTTTYLGEISQSKERTVTVDSDRPTIAISADFFGPGEPAGYVRSPERLVVAGEASDPTSYVAQVEIAPQGGTSTVAEGTGAWAYAWTTAGLPDGRQTLQIQAVDAVGNRSELGVWRTILDNTAPSASITAPDGPIRPFRDVEGRWRVPLRGTVADPPAGSEPGSGVEEVEVLLQGRDDLNGLAWQSATLSHDNAWSINYLLPEFGRELVSLPDPSGVYTAVVRMRDAVGNATLEADYPQLSITLDAAGPVVTPSLTLSDTVSIHTTAEINGMVSDASAIEAVEVNFTMANQMGALDGGALHLPFDELKPAHTFVDQSGSGRDVTCGVDHCPTPGKAGSRGGAFAFSGSGQYLEAPTLLDPAPGPFSAALWFNAAEVDGDHYLLQQAEGNGAGRTWLAVTAGKIRSNVGGVQLTGATGVSAGMWHHAALTFDGEMLRLYVDGVLAAQSPAAAEENSGPLLIGASDSFNAFYEGLLDELIVYERALAGYEVANLYAYGRTPWLPATLDGDSWRYKIAEGADTGLEGLFQLNVRGIDALGNVTQLDGQRVWRGEIDTKPPVVAFPVTVDQIGSAFTTTYACHAADFNLDDAQSCVVKGSAPGYRPGDETFTTYDEVDLWYASVISDTTRLYGIDAARTVDRELPNLDQLEVEACDYYGHCTTVRADLRADPLLPAASKVLAPSDHTVLTTTETVTVAGVAYAATGLEMLVVRIDGRPAYLDYWPTDDTIATEWSFSWTPPGEGIYRFVPQIDDWAGAVPAEKMRTPEKGGETEDRAFEDEPPELPPAVYLPLAASAPSLDTLQPADGGPMTLYLPIVENVIAVTPAYTGTTTLIYVDLAPPTVGISSTVLTAEDRIGPQTVVLSGSASDSVQLHDIAVRIDDGPWVSVGVQKDGRWFLPWTTDSQEVQTVEVTARATDVAGRSAAATAQVTVDLDGIRQ